MTSYIILKGGDKDRKGGLGRENYALGLSVWTGSNAVILDSPMTSTPSNSRQWLRVRAVTLQTYGREGG